MDGFELQPIIVVSVLSVLIILFLLINNRKHNERLQEEENKARVGATILGNRILAELGVTDWHTIPYYQDVVIVKSRAAIDKYDYMQYLREHKNQLRNIERTILKNEQLANHIRRICNNPEYTNATYFARVEPQLTDLLTKISDYRVEVKYITSAGNNLQNKQIVITQNMLAPLLADSTLLMTATEHNQYMRQQAQNAKNLEKQKLEEKRQGFYKIVNSVIDVANRVKPTLLNAKDKEMFDTLIDRLYDGTVNHIQKVKTSDSPEWDTIKHFVQTISNDLQTITARNDNILGYYNSPRFMQLQQTCSNLLASQREFNEYINMKAKNISNLFGVAVVRNVTQHNDVYNYLRPYAKTVTPFTAEVSSSVFASAENKPIEYIIKYFYPNKNMYPEQIQKLHLLIEELETLRDARAIVENHKRMYQQHMRDVPSFVLERDSQGFYSRLGFADIDESTLTIEYKFVYTSEGGFAQRSFTVPMTEENIIKLINTLENKLTMTAFTKEQRQLMTKKLRERIKQRDNYTCRACGNSTHREPNLLLEIDHIRPVSAGGITEESNLQTLCWKCNRRKGAKY